jgi:hypothetical protein
MHKHTMLLLVVILLAASIARMIFYAQYPLPGIGADSRSYYETGLLIEKNFVFVDAWRTPVYPVFLLAIEKATGLKDIGYQITPGDLSYAVLFIQSLIGIIHAGLFFLLLRRLIENTHISVVLALLFAIHPVVIGFERIISTESLAICWFTVFVFLAITLIKRVHPGLLFLFLGWSIFGAFLRPAFLPLPVFVLTYMWLKRRTTASFGYALICCLLYGGICFLYIQMNGSINQYPGFTRISDINIVGKILQFNLPVNTLPSDNVFKQSVELYRLNNGAPDPWRFLEAYPMYYNPEYFNQLSRAAKDVLFSAWREYSVLVLRQVPGALIDTKAHTIEWYFSFLQSPFLLIIKSVYLTSWIIRLVLLPSIGILLLFYKKRRGIHLFLYALTGIYILMSVALSYDDFGRHLIVLEVLFYLFAGIAVSWFISAVKMWYRRYQRSM